MRTEIQAPSGEYLSDRIPSSPVQSAEPATAPDPKTNIHWDLRPQGEVGNVAGAGAREIARLRNLETAGAVAWADEVLVGSGTIITQKPGMTIESHVLACEPIPANEMAPHQEDMEGIVTPLWPVGKAINLPTEE